MCHKIISLVNNFKIKRQTILSAYERRFKNVIRSVILYLRSFFKIQSRSAISIFHWLDGYFYWTSDWTLMNTVLRIHLS